MTTGYIPKANFSSPIKSKKEQAERPFTVLDFKNGGSHQFTIEEDLKISQNPRTARLPTRDGKSQYDVALLKVSDGLFCKDLKMFETEWNRLCAALPEGLISLKGVTMALDGEKIVYLCAEMPTPGPGAGNGASQQPTTPAPQQPPSEDIKYRQLAEAIILTQRIGGKTDGATVLKITETILPGDALGLIQRAKGAGWIVEGADGTYRGVV